MHITLTILSVVKRDNSYGDEPVVPAEVATEAPVAAVSAESDEGYAAPAEAATEAPVAEEYAPAEVGYVNELKLLVCITMWGGAVVSIGMIGLTTREPTSEK